MPEYLTLPMLAEKLLKMRSAKRQMIAIAGAPGTGKSTISETLKQFINKHYPETADILPMDGFHFDDAVLISRGHRAYKGAPYSFDLEGFRVMLKRVQEGNGKDIAIPVFDRTIEMSRAAAHIINANASLIICEGNYLLLDKPGWRELKESFDLTIMLKEPEDIIEERLRKRWLDLGFDPAAAESKLKSNDLPNMRLVLGHSLIADVILS